MFKFIKNIIEKFIDWYYKDEIAEFDRICSEIKFSRPFAPSTEDIIESIEFLKKHLNGTKISTVQNSYKNLEFQEINYCYVKDSFMQTAVEVFGCQAIHNEGDGL